MRILDLFSGIGGFHVAKPEGWSVVLSCEWDKYASRTYALNFPDTLQFGDVTTLVDVPDHDILTAGFPCQSFSIAGKQEGFNHPTQGTLFFDILRIITLKRPKAFVLENVPNLKAHDNGKTFEVILSALKATGYSVHYTVLDSSEFGVAQNRKRIYIVGFRDTSAEGFSVVGSQKCSGFSHILENAPEKYFMTNLESPSVQKMLDGVKDAGFFYQYRRYYMRKNESGLCPTLTANMGSGGHNVPLFLDAGRVRKLTPRECLRLQGFPESFKVPEGLADSHIYKQAGNSVSVPVIRAIYKEIEKCLNEHF